MTVLDRSKFTVHLDLAQAKFPDPKYIAQFAKECKADILQLRSINHVQKTEGNGRAVLLRHDLDMKKDVLDQLSPRGKELLTEAKAELTQITKDLDYDFWRADEIFYSVLPVTEKDEIPSGFSMVGHVAHLNLRSEWKDYDRLIGQVILDKNPRVKTVVNKVDSIDTKFRTFKMDVLAGEDNTEVEQHESGCRFQFDFAKVYWNSRLHTEHDRLVSLFRGEASSRERKLQERARRENHEKTEQSELNTTATAVCDVFAGVGPFAVPSGRTSLFVMANDLNPYSYEALEHNVKLNKVQEYVQCFNLDGAAYVQQSMALLDQYRKTNPTINPVQVRKRKAGQPVVKQNLPNHYSHYVMNLPDSAIEFLWSFKGLYSTVEGLSKDTPLPNVHVHCFHKWEAGEEEPSKEETKAALLERVYKQIDVRLDPQEVDMHWVRKVSPKKDMYCISFELPEEVAWAQQVKQ
ncbi:tRNA (guanine(37)-N1)-methyltransferase [Yarrowia sp. B02]|nr:tRNA (guanine(37)-N1)-methyltransferase [Yarrowia sp. B02]